MTQPSVHDRTEELFERHLDAVQRRTDRLFAWLMVVQYVAGIVIACLISPRTWAGPHSRVHMHVWTAALLGALIAALPVVLAVTRPGRFSTRCVVAAGQMFFSALLIHLSGGRIETHFHVFGSLAMIAFYRDWRVFIPATLVVAGDHFFRGLYWPESVYGISVASHWRFLEHAGWVVFEDVFLIRSCIQGARELREIARERAELEHTKAGVEDEVRQRTEELRLQATALEHEIAERKQAEVARAELHKQLVDISRQAGMSEVATGVLHNVGNVLNSVNVSASVVADRVKKSNDGALGQVADLMKQNENDLGRFMSDDARGRMIPGFLAELSKHWSDQQTEVLGELESLSQNIGHIKDIVAMQQSYARLSGMHETVKLSSLLDDAVRINLLALDRHGVDLTREFEDVPPITIDKQKVLQILVNLISNAKYAVSGNRPGDRRMTLRLTTTPAGTIRIDVIDNGMGIAAEHLPKLFAFGFTTRPDGHGFGLHSASLSTKVLGGAIRVHSDGLGKGAMFTLEFPAPVAAEVAS